jgi:hypothetical protein
MKWILAALFVSVTTFVVGLLLLPESCSEKIERLTLAGNVAAANLVECATH